MSVFKVVSRYANALLELSQEQGVLEEVKEDMEVFLGILKSNSEFRAVLANPIINMDRKINILKAIFEDKINPIILKFFTLMITKGRGGVISSTVEEFSRIYNELKGVQQATVTSANPLTEENAEKLKNLLEEETKSTIVLHNKVNTKLIGGFVVTIGDRRLDASIAGKLNKLERYFNAQGI